MAGRMMGVGMAAGGKAQTEGSGKGDATAKMRGNNNTKQAGSAGVPRSSRGRRPSRPQQVSHEAQRGEGAKQTKQISAARRKDAASDTPHRRHLRRRRQRHRTKGWCARLAALSPCAVAWLLNDDTDAGAWQTDSLGEWLSSATMRAATATAAKEQDRRAI